MKTIQPSSLDPGLHLVSTPIGHARDITLRALDVLAAADLVLCEDTRRTRRLYAIHEIEPRPLRAYHDHTRQPARERILRELVEGKRIALASDAGTPLLSDPGYRLVCAALDAGIAVHALPGASSLLPALQLSGLPPDCFTFAGFLPPRAGERGRMLESIAAAPGTLIFFETARRLPASLAELAERWPDRRAAVARELTKRFQCVRRGTLAELAELYALAENRPRGEIVLLLARAHPGQPDADQLDRALDQALERMSVRDAADLVALASRAPRRAVYARALIRARRV